MLLKVVLKFKKVLIGNMYLYSFINRKINALLLIVSLTFLNMASVSVFASESEELRIIALAPHIVENLYAIGAGDLIIGATEHADYPKQALDIPRVGNYVRLNIEQILAAEPNLIIAWKTGSHSDDFSRLASLGIKIVYSELVEIEDVAKELKYFGQLTGNEEKANQLADDFLIKLKQLREKYQASKPVSVFFEMWSRPLTTVANQAWLQQQIEVCNITNPFVESPTDYPQINVEQVVLKAPEIIIQPSSHSESAPDRVNWQQWEHIPAVKNKAFIHPDADKLYRTTIRSLDELTLLCEQIDSLR